MRLKATLLTSALLFGALAGSLSAQVDFVGASGAQAEVSSLLDKASKLEAERRWGEVLTLYEEALREHPGLEPLNTRHDLAKLHYDIGRRYNDSSFVRAVTTLTEREALLLYSEVLVKIQSHYVGEPDWNSLVRRGMSSLSVAGSEQGYANRHLRSKSKEQLAAFQQQLERWLSARAIRNRQDAIDAVSGAARQAQQQIGVVPAAVILEFACGAMGALDEYSSYLTGDQLNDVYSQIEGNFVGLGVELKATEGALLIVKVITGSPAQRSGLKPGDRIMAVDGKSTATLTTDQAADLLQGVEGSTVEISALGTNNLTRKISVRRAQIDVPSVDGVKIVDRDYGVAYLKLTCFQKTTSRDLDTALWKLHREGMKSLIVDLRGNPGGLLTSSVEVVDKFVDEGVIVSTRGRNSLEDYNYTAHKAGTWRVPLIVLIDGDSASASEIFAGAIRDHRRGTIIGQRSYGKGSVQGIFPLTQANSGVRLTTAKFYSPSGKPISKVGVMPDVVVQRTAKPASPADVRIQSEAEDLVLKTGIQAARQQVAQR